jgi:hypothetical protein
MSIRTALLPKQNVYKYFYLLLFNRFRISLQTLLNETLNIPDLEIPNIRCLTSYRISIMSRLISIFCIPEAA